MSDPIGGCYDCQQVTSGRCWRHQEATLVFDVPTYVQCAACNAWHHQNEPHICTGNTR